MIRWLRRALPIGLAVAAAFAAVAEGPATVVADWRTPAEADDFQSTPSYDETIAFLRRLATRSPAIRLEFYGTSAQGRPLPIVIVSKEGAFEPAAARALESKPILLIVNGIHGGEIDGKDASLILLREIALGRAEQVLDAATLLVVPIYNVDGHERVSPYNRPNQDGPREGMGFRTTADGLNLNRDHLKVVSPETRALLELFNAWRPHLHVDTHVSDGVDLEWTLTFSMIEAPQASPSIQEWWSANLPPVVSAMARAGHRIGPYVDLLDSTDPSKGFSSWVGSPRVSNGYFNLRNRPSLLVEMHSYKPYGERVAALRDFLALLVLQAGRSGRALREAVAAAEERVVALGRPDAPGSEIVLEWDAEPPSAPVRVPFYAFRVVDSEPLGRPVLQYDRATPAPMEIPWSHRAKPVRTAPRPRGYLVESGWPVIEERLAAHGLRVERLEAEAEIAAEALRVAEPRFENRPNQGQVRLSCRVEHEAMTRRFPRGTLFVPADQPDFEVAVQLLEPECPESLLAWGMLDQVFERKEYIDPSVLHRLASSMLAQPEIAEEWNTALATDASLASDPTARYLWWYRRTPYWDDTVGLFPVFRVTTPLEGVHSPHP